MFAMGRQNNKAKRGRSLWAWLLWAALFVPTSTRGQTWVWTLEDVDISGVGTALAVDADGNVHISYGGDSGLKYGFRPANESRWFTMPLGRSIELSSITVDRQGNPHICATYHYLPFRYAHYDGRKWSIQEINIGQAGQQATCSIAVGPDGTPHVAWYRVVMEDFYAHLRYAFLKDGEWMLRTLDFDSQTGKWNSMVVDSQGNPYISYDAYVKGILKCAHWDGKHWKVWEVDSRALRRSNYNVGMGSSLALDSDENVRISYYTDSDLRYARQQDKTWKTETVDTISPSISPHEFRSSLVLDRSGFPHISYEDIGTVKHAYWDGNKWHIQIIASSGPVPFRYSSMGIDKKKDTLYVSFRDSVDGSLKVAVGQRVEEPQANLETEKENNK
jgi:hypothetical protein